MGPISTVICDYDKAIADAARKYIAIEHEHLSVWSTSPDDIWNDLLEKKNVAYKKLLWAIKAEKEGLNPNKY